tara:strand:- start:49 stop:345 length:297 start_codon:yes stop_codon:yes gene_type:complete
MAKEGLRKWFSRNKGKGWVDCKTGKPCGRRKGEKRKGYPACRPTMAQCTSAAKKKKGPKRISWKDGRMKKSNGGVVEIRIARGCGKVMNDRRKKTKFY